MNLKETIKLRRFARRPKSNSGIILIVVLWILVILTMMAVGLGRRTSVDLALTKHSIGKFKAKYTAMGGLFYVLEKIRQDSEDETTKDFDTLYRCAIRLEEGETPKDIFYEIPIGEGNFDVGYTKTDPAAVNIGSQPESLYYGLQDEAGRLNLNALTGQNYKVLKELVVLLGYDDNTAETIAASVLDWKDTDSDVTIANLGAEDQYYMGLTKPYHCKNAFFDSVEELLLVKGISEEIFDDLKNYVTVFPKGGNNLWINFDTASEIVLQALFRSYSGAVTNTDQNDADSLTVKVIAYREGDDGQEATEDDRQIDGNDLGLIAKENVIFRSALNNRTKVSQHIRVKVRSTDPMSSVQSNIEAVVQRSDLSILYWRRI